MHTGGYTMRGLRTTSNRWDKLLRNSKAGSRTQLLFSWG